MGVNLGFVACAIASIAFLGLALAAVGYSSWNYTRYDSGECYVLFANTTTNITWDFYHGGNVSLPCDHLDHCIYSVVGNNADDRCNLVGDPTQQYISCKCWLDKKYPMDIHIGFSPDVDVTIIFSVLFVIGVVIVGPFALYCIWGDDEVEKQKRAKRAAAGTDINERF